ncbi:hypothetical protein A2801_02550 [Candidatus Woesebacteria bacterium RIFCSPHIGHO2_01_FULL_41_10]|uniref:Uncharacterized protein n=1 Tax=Candidatus Woesebacteria bacterium RIFCSPHIGHO2_01_FULL_41_10 TaxID=1802500 RepID=A0A1F7YM00_9BACT|nr:MAG: hypothetical protein A2801_02550 [Candidatus Woesebacteria bacterium RIFCSPHIGHO2_01_FULL_41_10]
MRRKHINHLPHYLPLIGVFTAGALAFWLFSYDKQFQAAVAISVAVAHITWGLIHHFIHRDLTISVFLEYVAISILGLAAVLSIVFRS